MCRPRPPGRSVGRSSTTMRSRARVAVGDLDAEDVADARHLDPDRLGPVQHRVRDELAQHEERDPGVVEEIVAGRELGDLSTSFGRAGRGLRKGDAERRGGGHAGSGETTAPIGGTVTDRNLVAVTNAAFGRWGSASRTGRTPRGDQPTGRRKVFVAAVTLRRTRRTTGFHYDPIPTTTTARSSRGSLGP